MKCFIASAFGRDDVNDIYDNCIIPTLKKLSVTPLRVDRIEHNDEIDNKIFELLDSSDFVIVDLTYARPSVYYEAGYATGKLKPVIYIVKSDHFKKRVDDQIDNFRVHFDLQMKNIISWEVPDQKFSDSIFKRIEHVLRPIKRQSQIDLKLQTVRDKFESKPILEQLMLLQKIAVKLLRKRSFSIHQPSKRVDFNGFTPTLETQLIRFNINTRDSVSIIATSSALKSLFSYISYVRPHLYFTDPSIPIHPFENTHYIVLTLKTISRSQIMDRMPNFSLQIKGMYSSEEYKSNHDKSTVKTYVHIVDGIKSEAEFTEKFRKLLEENDLLKNGG